MFCSSYSYPRSSFPRGSSCHLTLRLSPSRAAPFSDMAEKALALSRFPQTGIFFVSSFFFLFLQFSLSLSLSLMRRTYLLLDDWCVGGNEKQACAPLFAFANPRVLFFLSVATTFEILPLWILFLFFFLSSVLFARRFFFLLSFVLFFSSPPPPFFPFFLLIENIPLWS